MSERARVVRIYHSAVVGAYRTRDRELRASGVDLWLIAPRRWNEGGRDVCLEQAAEEEPWVNAARTVGRHPYRFVYDPRPIARALRRHRPVILDVHEEPASLAVAEVLVLRRVFAPDSRVTFYSAQNIAKRYPLPFRWVERWALRTARAVYCCNTEAAEVLRAKGFLGDTPVIGLGVDVERFSPKGAVSRDEFVVGYVGRLERHKGVDVLLRALTLLPDVKAVVVGAGPAQAQLQAQAAPLGPRVRFLDFIAHDQLPELYRSFDVVAIPSRTTARWKEQFGRVAVEAMASGVPVVASSDGSLPEVVGDGGILVPSDDAEALAAAIGRLRDDDDLRAMYAASAYAQARRYAWTAIAQRHRRVYEDVLR